MDVDVYEKLWLLGRRGSYDFVGTFSLAIFKSRRTIRSATRCNTTCNTEVFNSGKQTDDLSTFLDAEV